MSNAIIELRLVVSFRHIFRMRDCSYTLVVDFVKGYRQQLVELLPQLIPKVAAFSEAVCTHTPTPTRVFSASQFSDTVCRAFHTCSTSMVQGWN